MKFLRLLLFLVALWFVPAASAQNLSVNQTQFQAATNLLMTLLRLGITNVVYAETNGHGGVSIANQTLYFRLQTNAVVGGGGSPYAALTNAPATFLQAVRFASRVDIDGDLYLNGLAAGSPTNSGSGEINTGVNLGSGLGVFASKSGTNLQFYSFAVVDTNAGPSRVVLDNNRLLFIVRTNAPGAGGSAFPLTGDADLAGYNLTNGGEFRGASLRVSAAVFTNLPGTGPFLALDANGNAYRTNAPSGGSGGSTSNGVYSGSLTIPPVVITSNVLDFAYARPIRYLTADPIFTTANRAAGAEMMARIYTGTTNRIPTWSEAWVATGANLPALLKSNSWVTVSLSCRSNSVDSVDVALSEQQ